MKWLKDWFKKKSQVPIYDDLFKERGFLKSMFTRKQGKYGLRYWFALFIIMVIMALVIVSFEFKAADALNIRIYVFLFAFLGSALFAVAFYVHLNDQNDFMNSRKKLLSGELREYLKCQEFQYEIEAIIDRLKNWKNDKGEIKSKPRKNLTDLLVHFRDNVMAPRRENGFKENEFIRFEEVEFQSREDENDDAYNEWKKALFKKLKDGDSSYKKVRGIANLKSQIRILEPGLARHIHFPFVFSTFSAVVFLLYYLVGTAELSAKIPYLTNSFTALLGTGLAMYLSKSFSDVAPDQMGMKYIFGVPYQLASRGKRFTLKGVVMIRTLPNTVQYLNVAEDVTLLVGKESQKVTTNVSQPYRYIDYWDVLDGLGEDHSKIQSLLEGIEVKNDNGVVTGKKGGMIGDKIVTVVRNMLASETEVPNLDTALQMRKPLATKLKKILNQDYGHLGLQFDIANTTDIDPDIKMIEERNKKSLTKVKAETAEIEIEVAEHQAQAGIKRTDGKAIEIKEIGKADAEVIYVKGKAEAGVIRLKGKAEATRVLNIFKADVNAMKYLKDKGVADQALPIITTLIMGEKPITEVANAMSDLKVNLFQIPGIDKILKLIGAFTGNFTATGTES